MIVAALWRDAHERRSWEEHRTSVSCGMEEAMPTSDLRFDQPELAPQLVELSQTELDDVDFGVVRLDADGHVLAYNRWEASLSGLDPQRVVGQHFFTQVAPCTNNFMVAERFSEAALDDVIDYVFTFRMRPTKVRLRLIVDGSGRFLLVDRG